MTIPDEIEGIPVTSIDEYKKPGSTSWKTIGKRGATYKSVSFNIETTGTYQARVYIQDASDYVTVKTFKVTVS